MTRKRYSEEPIAFALRQAESGMAVEEICRKLGCPSRPFTGGISSSPGWAWRRSGG